MSLGNITLVAVCILVGLYALGLVVGMIALFPYGLIGLIVGGFVGFLLVAVLNQKLKDRENRHYEENVKE